MNMKLLSKTLLYFSFQEKYNKFILTKKSLIFFVNDNFDSAVNILLGVGCKTKYYYEKLREIWNIKNSKVVFDMNPGIPERMEVESPTLKKLAKIKN